MQQRGRTLAAVLFTDMVESTAIAEELGDRRWKALVDAHHRIVRRELKRFGGTELDTAGDGFFASFKEPAPAITCACSIAEAVRDLGVEIRAGVHFGECERIGKKLGGITVVVGARIMALGGAGDVLVSSTAAELSRGAGFRFDDRGMRQLKGVDDAWGVFAATAVDGKPRAAPLDADDARQRRGGIAPETPRRKRLLVASAAIVALALVTTAIVVPRVRGVGDTTVAPNSLGRFDPASGRLRSAIPVGSRPSAVVATDEAVWVANAADGTVSKIDPSSGAVVDTIDVGSDPESLAIGEDAVWVANADARTVSQIDPASDAVVQTIAVGNGPIAVAASSSGIWVANSIDGTVQRLDPVRGIAERPIDVGGFPSAITSDGETVWVANRTDGTVSVIDAGSQRVTSTIHVGTDPSGVASVDGGVWVTNRSDGTASFVAAGAAAVSDTMPAGRDPHTIAVDSDDVWVASADDGTIWQLGSGPAAAPTIVTGSAPTGIALTGDDLWVTTVARTDGAHRGGTLRVTADRRLDSIDPAFGYSSTSWSILSMTNDGLVGYRRADGVSGTTLVPDLATALPEPTDAGRRYTFQLRPNISFSDGEPVTPEAFRTAIERSLRLGTPRPDYYASIVGAPACIAAPDRCDLSQGILVDDATGTVTFQLHVPDPDFLYKLALPFAFAVPPATPDRTVVDAGRLATPVPATGPYQIDSYDRTTLTLERNPAFNAWSTAAQPDGFPDQIVWTFGQDPTRSLTSVEQGTSDLVWGGVAPDQVREVTTRFPSRSNVSPILSTRFLTLNTTRPPFDEVAARRAMNFAIDRDAVFRQFGGPELASLSCQELPPNMPGYRPYCPYTLSPSKDGAWTAPNMQRALELVHASGTQGAVVDVATFAGIDPGLVVGRSVVRVLEDLGYRAELHEMAADTFFSTIADSSKGVDVSVYGWLIDYPSPASFIADTLTCASYYPNDPHNQNISGFCDPQVDDAIAIAQATQTHDPAAAAQQWARVDRLITDAAPHVPLIAGQQVDLVSERVGNFQFHPMWGVLLDQLWVQ